MAVWKAVSKAELKVDLRGGCWDAPKVVCSVLILAVLKDVMRVVLMAGLTALRWAGHLVC